MMLGSGSVPKDLMFKLRLDEQDRERLDAVAAHYSAPAATAIRILIKERYDQLPTEERERVRKARAAKQSPRRK